MLLEEKSESKEHLKIAIKAVAGKLAVLYWKLFVKRLDYQEKEIEAYEEKIMFNKQMDVIRMAKELVKSIAYKNN